MTSLKSPAGRSAPTLSIRSPARTLLAFSMNAGSTQGLNRFVNRILSDLSILPLFPLSNIAVLKTQSATAKILDELVTLYLPAWVPRLQQTVVRWRIHHGRAAIKSGFQWNSLSGTTNPFHSKRKPPCRYFPSILLRSTWRMVLRLNKEWRQEVLPWNTFVQPASLN